MLFQNRTLMKVRNWLHSLKQNKNNDSILLIFHSDTTDKVLKKISDDIKEYYLNDSIIQTYYDILDVKDYNSDMKKNIYLSNRNIILVADRYTSLSKIRNLKIKVLPYFLTKGIAKLSDDVNLKNIDNEELKDETEADNLDIVFIELRDPIDIIKRTEKEMKSFVFEYLENISYFKDAILNNLLQATNLTGKIENLIDKTAQITITNEETRHNVSSSSIAVNSSPEIEYLKRDIVILKEKGILISRLAIVIYRKCFLDRYANVTEIGLYYKKMLGSKSKVVDLKKISKYTSTNYEGLLKTKVKAYDLNNTVKNENQIRLELERDIKEHLAKKLLYFTDIHIDTIQRIVELPMSTLKDYR